MTATSRNWTPVLLAIACLISAGNVGLYVLLSKRFATVEAALSSPTHKAEATNLGATDATWGDSTSAQRPLQRGVPNEPGKFARALKQQKADFNPGAVASSMDRLMAQEPSIPAMEQAQVKLLQQAIQSLPPDVPQPAGLQTTCQGRRCLISAGFMDDTQAGDWADKLLLAGGKNLPKAARIVSVPLEGGNGAVSLQLYLY